MSNEQSNSSKKLIKSKNEFIRKIRDFTSKRRVKLTKISSKAKSQLSAFYSDKIIHQEVYVDGKEPKSYSFQRKFFGLYAIFILYSLLLITAINFPKNNWINLLMLGNPFAFSNSIVAFFLVLSFLYSVDKVRIFFFEEKTAIKQISLYFSLLVALYLLFLYFSYSTNLNFMTYLLSLAMIWLVLLSSRFYIYSRKFSTKIEARFIKKYSIPRYFLAIIIPFFILGVLVVISLFYRSLLVFISLDIFGNVDPTSAVKVYNLEMRVIMPLIYFSLVMTLVFIIFEFVLTRRRAETKRAGTFDNFTFSLIVLFIFFFQIFQISVFLFLQEDTITGLKATIGATGSAASYIFIFEFMVSMYFLYRIVKKTGRTLGWRILIFKKDGLILLFLACVLAQTLSRFALASQVQNQVISDVGVLLMADKYIISVLMIFFLGSTILIYYLKPHETSIFMRLQKETVSEEKKSMDRIYKIIRSEYIRRGKAYPIEIIERELIKATQLSKGNVYALLEQLAGKDMDIVITEEAQDLGNPIKMINFVSVTERFEKKGVAKQKARRYLSERLLETALEKDRKKSRLKNKVGTSKASDSFISSLSSDFSKKQKDKGMHVEKLKKADIPFSSEQLPEDLKNKIFQIIRKEYIYRIENPEKIPDFYIPISELSTEIELATKITPGELYLILEDLNKKDIEISLVKNPDEPEDKKIRILPFADDNLNYSLANFRPDEYSSFRIFATKFFLKNLKTKKEKRVLFQLKKQIPKEKESQKSWINLLDNLYKYYPLYSEQSKKIPDISKLRIYFDEIIKNSEKR